LIPLRRKKTEEHIELIVEFSVILLAPLIHTYYLWKVKGVDQSVIQQNVKIFSFFLSADWNWRFTFDTFTQSQCQRSQLLFQQKL